MKRVSSQTPTMTHLVVFISTMLLMMGSFIEVPGAVAESGQKTDAIPVEDYALYDQVVTSKFLTSATQLVVIERTTQFRLSPDQEGPTTIGAFQEQGYFDGELPADLIREFTTINRQPSRLEGRFHFGVSYRFATGDRLEEPEVSLARPVTGSSRKTGSSAVGVGSYGLLPRGTKPSQRSCAAVCRSPTSRRHWSRIPRVVPSSRTKLDVV